MREQDYVTPYDTALLLATGFTFGISSEFLWGVDKDGNKWQAVEDAEYYKFGKLEGLIIKQRNPMTREQFDELFGGK